jgi:exodeoxyribonuclease VII small subunit
MPANPKSPPEEPGFDARLARLEQIVGELEAGGLALEPSIARYQEGVALLRDCRGILEGYKKRVEEISASAPGGVAPYAADPDARETA